MSESKSPEAAPKSGLTKFLLFAVLPFFLLCVLTPVALHMSAGSSLDDRVAKLEAELTEYRASRKPQRTPRFGSAKKGNAVDYYNALEYVTSKRPAWKKSPPANLPELGSLKALATKPDKDYYSTSQRLDALLKGEARNRDEKIDAKKEGLRDVDKKRIQTFLPMVNFVEEGLRCDRVEWPADFELGPSMPIPSMLAARFAANLMAFRARNAKGSEKIDWGLKICAFGGDYALGSTMIMQSIAMSLEEMGFRSLQESMESPLSAKDYQRIINFMESVPTYDASRTLKEEALVAKCTMAFLGGRKVNDVEMPPMDEVLEVELGPMDTMMASTFFIEREWKVYEELYEKYVVPAAEKKNDEMPALEKEFEAELEGTWTIYSKLALPAFYSILGSFKEHENRSKLVALLAAAHLHRLKTGKFPEKIDSLADYFPNKTLPQNTSVVKAVPFDYELKDGQVTVSVPGSKSEIYRTWVPK